MLGALVTYFNESNSADLYPAVAPVGYYNVSIDIDRNSCRGIELAITFTIRSKLQQEFPFCVEHLYLGFQGGNSMEIEAKITKTANKIQKVTHH